MKKEIAELIGTFAMVFCGCGAMTINEITGGDITLFSPSVGNKCCFSLIFTF